MNSSLGEREDLAFQARQLLAHALGDLGEALEVQAHAEQLHLAQHRHERQLDLAHHALAGRARRSARAASRPARRAAARRRRAGPRGRWPGRALRTARRTGSRAAPARAGRRRAACRARAPAARAERLGVVRDDRPLGARRDDLLGPVAIAGEHLGGLASPLADAAKRHGAPSANSSPSGVSTSRTTSAQLGARASPARRCPRARPRAAAAQRDLGGGRRRGDVGVAERLLQATQRIAQLVLAEDLAQRERSGSRTCSAATSRSTARSRCTVASCLDMRASSACSMQVLFALGAFDLVDVREHLLERAEALQQLAGGLVADAGDAGDVVRGVALQAVEVGDQLGRDAVAVDHRLAVVDLRLGDAARGRHHLDEAVGVDQLEGVAVAGDDHHRHGRLGAQRALGERGDHVVGLVALDRDVGVAERLDQRFHRGPLLLEQVRARATRGLVLGEQLVAPRAAGVPGDDGRTHAVLGDDLHEHRGEAEDRVRRHAGRRGDRLGQREERAVDEARAVDQEQPPIAARAGARGRLRRVCSCRPSTGHSTRPRRPP